jgi:DNA processing protein
MTERECGYWVNNIPGVGTVIIDRLYDYFGDARAIFNAKREELEKIKNITEKKILAIESSKDIDKIKKNMEVIKEKGIEFVLRNEENYPKKLAEIYAPPRILYFRGSLPEENKPTLAVVGARNCTEYGSFVTKRITNALAQQGFQIVSGMARGIDAYAHKGALECPKGKTFGVLGCGIDTCYPPENIEIFINSIKNGGIISEYPMYTVARAGNFPMRNRIISGLSDALLVVEAKKKSGSLITVDYALDQGKDVYVIPGRLDDPLSEGCNNLIKMGAKVVTSVEDILEDFGMENSYLNNNNYEQISNEHLCKNSEENKIVLASDEKIVYACLRLEPKHINEIICETQLGFSEVIRILFSLEEKEMIVQVRNNHYVRLN